VVVEELAGFGTSHYLILPLFPLRYPVPFHFHIFMTAMAKTVALIHCALLTCPLASNDAQVSCADDIPSRPSTQEFALAVEALRLVAKFCGQFLDLVAQGDQRIRVRCSFRFKLPELGARFVQSRLRLLPFFALGIKPASYATSLIS
jgi:hypothetical protein